MILRGIIPLVLAIAPLPAKALPQWIPVSSDANIFADFNSLKKKAGIHTVVVSARTPEAGSVAGYMHIECASWRWASTVGASRSNWEPIAIRSVPESVAYLVCRTDEVRR